MLYRPSAQGCMYASRRRVVTCQASAWQVHKFGGTCLATAERINDAANFIAEINTPVLIIVSAVGSSTESPVKVTDKLLNLIRHAENAREDTYCLDLQHIRDKHVQLASELLIDKNDLESYTSELSSDISNLSAMLKAISIARSSSDVLTNFIIGHGEIWSAKLLSKVCAQKKRGVHYLDAREVLVVDCSDGLTDLKEESSREKLENWLSEKKGACVIATGFIARTPDGVATTLQRNGSDLSATMFGALLHSSQVTIWTDVDGVFSADPRKVPEAHCLASITYSEARELAYFGANVLHPHTTVPAVKHGIPVVLRNFFNRDCPGTYISKNSPILTAVKGLATIDNVSLISVEGTGMVGIPGVASTVFGVMKDIGVNIILISQASSEQSICFAVDGKDGNAAVHALQHRFSDALRSERLSAVKQWTNCCVLAAIGEGMVNRKGVAATFFGALAKANINIKAIAQGSSEYNISVLVDQIDGERALRAAHSRFYLSSVPLGLALVGPGQIGSALIEQLALQTKMLKERMGTDIRLLAIANSSHMLLSQTGIKLDSWQAMFSEEKQAYDLTLFENHLASSHIPNHAIVDCTASDATAEHYTNWMTKGFHVVTPNKKLGSGPVERYQKVKSLQRNGLIHFFYEATVGAGLPIMGTLKHLIETGDQVLSIEGIFSGTLSYIFNTWHQAVPFSAVVKEAKELGYTEPDPRDDLSGLDVARKVTILARECGLQLELHDVYVESLVPSTLQSCDKQVFMDKLPTHDLHMLEKLTSAANHDCFLRYVGVVDIATGRAEVKLKEYSKDHPFAQLQGTDNIILFRTERYNMQPLVIRGPGAGAAVTAGGVFSDILKLAAYLGAPS